MTFAFADVIIKQSTTTPYHAVGNGIIENFNKTIKNLLKKVAAERPNDWHRYLGPLMFAVRDTPQDSTRFTPFRFLYGYVYGAQLRWRCQMPQSVERATFCDSSCPIAPTCDAPTTSLTVASQSWVVDRRCRTCRSTALSASTTPYTFHRMTRQVSPYLSSGF